MNHFLYTLLNLHFQSEGRVLARFYFAFPWLRMTVFVCSSPFRFSLFKCLFPSWPLFLWVVCLLYWFVWVFVSIIYFGYELRFLVKGAANIFFLCVLFFTLEECHWWTEASNLGVVKFVNLVTCLRKFYLTLGLNNRLAWYNSPGIIFPLIFRHYYTAVQPVASRTTMSTWFLGI